MRMGMNAIQVIVTIYYMTSPMNNHSDNIHVQKVF
jgi:hypothetical protein